MAVEIIRGRIADQAVEAITIADGCDGLRTGNVLLKSDETGKFRGIIHVADHDETGSSSEQLIQETVLRILDLVEREKFWSVAMPVLGVGPRLPEFHALASMLLTIYESKFMGGVVIVREPEA